MVSACALTCAATKSASCRPECRARQLELSANHHEPAERFQEEVTLSKLIEQIVFFVAIVSLSGCSTMYSPPPAAEREVARLRVAQTEEAFQTLPFWLPDKCLKNPRYAGGEKYITLFGTVMSPDTRARDSLGIPGAPDSRNNYHELRVPAGKEFNFEFFRVVSMQHNVVSTRYNTCQIGFSFVPQVGRDYEAVISNVANGCHVSLNQIVAKDGQVERLPVNAVPIDGRSCRK